VAVGGAMRMATEGEGMGGGRSLASESVRRACHSATRGPAMRAAAAMRRRGSQHTPGMRPGVRPCTASAGPPGSAAAESSAPLPASSARRLATDASSPASRPEAAARVTALRRQAARGSGGARKAPEEVEVVVLVVADGPRPHAAGVERSTPAMMSCL